MDGKQRRRKQYVYYQVGAPALIYNQKNDDSSLGRPTQLLVKDNNERISTILESTQRSNRAKARWNYSVDLDNVENIRVAHTAGTSVSMGDEDGRYARGKAGAALYAQERQQDRTSLKCQNFDKTRQFDRLFASDYRKQRVKASLQRSRLTMLLSGDARGDFYRDLLENYTSFDFPYIPGELAYRENTKEIEVNLGSRRSLLTRRFSLDHQQSSDPSYLAPFDSDCLLQGEYAEDDAVGDTKSKTAHQPQRKPQGNCLLLFQCPCLPCRDLTSSQSSWCLLHPKGPCMDRICASNLITPHGRHNAGHIYKLKSWESKRTTKYLMQGAFEKLPNELDLHETILEIKQSGTWTGANNPECIFVVRTGTHISVLNICVKKPNYTKVTSDFEDGVCWGNYVMEERERIDLRSLSSHIPSYTPVSLTCHPRYGNSLTKARFAFVSHSDRDECNVIHHKAVGTEQGATRHVISCLKEIALVDYTSYHPMCLWSAASSYVRPTLVCDVQHKQPFFGTGTSLYTIDLRSNDAMFQWSPSAEESITEGVHSISGIFTDWERENTVWVASKSAGKTWELDCRMPYRAVNVWSLSSGCEDSDVFFPQKGFYGEGSILAKPQMSDATWESPILNIDTSPGAFGFYIYQQPLERPRFQTKSLECIATPGLDASKRSSIATTSVFALPEVADHVYACGMSSFRIPFGHFLDEKESHLVDYANQDSKVLCTLIMNNLGDLYCYTLLESNEHIKNYRPYSDLPAGTRVLAVPETLNGKTKELEQKHWKPTGGMNVKLYLTNQYPTPMCAMPPQEKSPLTKRVIITGRKRKRRKKNHTSFEIHPSLQIEQNAPVFKIASDPTGITIEAESKDLTRHESISIPLSLVEKSKKSVSFEKPRILKIDAHEKKERSDLSHNILQEAYDYWNDTDSESKVAEDATHDEEDSSSSELVLRSEQYI